MDEDAVVDDPSRSLLASRRSGFVIPRQALANVKKTPGIQNRLRALRETAGLTLEELGAKTSATNQEISLLELGRRKLTVEWLIRLSKALSCHPWDIVEETGSLLTPAERKLVSTYRSLDRQGRRLLLRKITDIHSGKRSRQKSTD
ncbi:MAG: helix-turn-helix domain-containing protein [Hyphomonadaceae bacterium]